MSADQKFRAFDIVPEIRGRFVVVEDLIFDMAERNRGCGRGSWQQRKDDGRENERV